MAKPTLNLSQALSRAMSAYNAGKLVEAEQICQQIINIKRDLFDALHLLAIVQSRQGKKDTALASYRRALALRPDSAEVLSNRGVTLKELKRFEEALASFDRALKVRPDYAEALSNRGRTLHELKRFEEALASYDHALTVRADHAETLVNRGVTLYELKRFEEALASYECALKVRPDFAEALSNRGNTLKELKRFEEALASYDRALTLRPDFAEALYNRGNTLHELKRFEEALASYDRALTLRPDFAEALYNRGVTLYELKRLEEALASYDKAIALKSDYADAHCNEAMLRLLTGDFNRGWAKYEWRWKTKHMSGGARHFSAPLWSGESIGDRVILLHAEQGLGDTLQFCRYVPLIAAGARIVLEVQAPLVRLLSRLPGLTEIIARGDSLPAFDLHCPLLSLPRAIGTTLDTIPASTPYLAADPALAADWRKRLAGLDGLRVGLVWSGGQSGQRLGSPDLVAVDRRRSIALDRMAPLGEASGVSFISLQKDEAAAQSANPSRGMALHDFTADLHDFEDTAALVTNLDLVISVDTSVAHLAGALGKPVWLLNRFDTCWRWLLNRDDSPWYPTLRQFRQPSPGDWNSVIRAVRDALQRLADGDAGS